MRVWRTFTNPNSAATKKAFAEADKVVRLVTHYPRCHPAPLECCGCVADVNPATGKLTWGDKVNPGLTSPGTPAPPTLGEESWKWLFLQPLITQD